MLRLYTVALFLSAFLLFSIQPMLGRIVLPSFGGTASVWTTCLLFYQAILLLGYLYAYLGPRWLGGKLQASIHLFLLFASIATLHYLHLPAPSLMHMDASPLVELLWFLTQSAAFPMVLLSATAPLLQQWFARSGHPHAKDPYFLYVASNAGSMLALLAYTFTIEPWFPLSSQRWGWIGGYALFLILILGCYLLQRRALPSTDSAPEPPKRLTKKPVPLHPLIARNGYPLRLCWLILAFIPSSWLTGVTTHLTSNLAPVPLLWIVPLALYLLSYIIAFSRVSERWLRMAIYGLPIVLGVSFLIEYQAAASSLVILLTLALVTFFYGATVCHATLASLRPQSQQLAEFYLWLAFGGMLGSLFNALIAPMLFTTLFEYPLVQLAACLLSLLMLYSVEKKPLSTVKIAYSLGVTGLLVVLLVRQQVLLDNTLITIDRERNFYGSIRIASSADGKTHRLLHGNIVHGIQMTTADPRVQRTPLSYFYPTGPAGQLFAALKKHSSPKPVAIIGLGVGSLAAYAQPNQEITFFELNPSVIRIAGNPKLFTFLQDSPGRCNTILGDARLMLTQQPASYYSMIVVDAFNAESIPAHLLTREAIQIYLEKLLPEGLLLFHISNEYVSLSPVLAGACRDLKLSILELNDDNISSIEASRGKIVSHWVVIARDASDLSKLALGSAWKPAPVNPGIAAWTDDYSNIVSVFRWK